MAGRAHHVDFEAVRRSAATLKKEQAEVEGRLKKLKSMIDGLVSSEFVTAKATGKFQENYNQWNTGAANVIRGLEGMSAFLETAVQRHEQVDLDLQKGS